MSYTAGINITLYLFSTKQRRPIFPAVQYASVPIRRWDARRDGRELDGSGLEKKVSEYEAVEMFLRFEGFYICSCS